ncbi:MAG: hypothetical protein AVDCRST_MAG77-5640 [uncultured Chloroflexi bacterium]|uniref:DUF4177 domain-containing protein n=1 Tax=uncultured Chloroflexota bacterium TaxID=166587 RepID=A0A6J4K6H2_9CHLR|nr:MAG: hypothetical protein AVDCRST_MAG77-5640 [uncultured Chloroflexota bacterium]
MIRWEYAYLFVGMRGSDHVVASLNGRPVDIQNNPQTPWDVMNTMGAEGWEFVAAVPTSPLQNTRQAGEQVVEGYWIFYLKRPRLDG